MFHEIYTRTIDVFQGRRNVCVWNGHRDETELQMNSDITPLLTENREGMCNIGSLFIMPIE